MAAASTTWDQVATGVSIVAGLATIVWVIGQKNAAATPTPTTGQPTQAQQNAQTTHALKLWSQQAKSAASTGILR